MRGGQQTVRLTGDGPESRAQRPAVKWWCPTMSPVLDIKKWDLAVSSDAQHDR